MSMMSQNFDLARPVSTYKLNIQWRRDDRPLQCLKLLLAKGQGQFLLVENRCGLHGQVLVPRHLQLVQV